MESSAERGAVSIAQNQLAASVAASWGKDYNSSVPKSPLPINDLLPSIQRGR